MSRRANTDLRCPGCRMLGALCVCALVPSPPLATRTRVLLVIHHDEDRKPTSSGRLAARCVAGSVTLVRGLGEEVDPRPLLGAHAVLLFPDPDAEPLDRVAAALPAGAAVTLVVPEGTWRQARRVRARVPGLDAIPCAVLPEAPPPAHRLRHEPRPGGLSTLDAIARALGILDGPEVEAAVERVGRAMVERTLWSRGALADADVTDGLPAGVSRGSRRALGLEPGLE